MVKKKAVQEKRARQKNNMPVSKAVLFRNRIQERISAYLARRPHRSFKKTRRRDYVRSLKLPGYWAFTRYVRRTISKRKKLFLALILIYALLTALLVGIASQETYSELSQSLRDSSGDIFKGNWGSVGQAALLLFSGATGAYSDAISSNQQVTTVVMGLVAWLTTVWLLRAQLAGSAPKLRDGLYAAGAPIISTFLVGLVFIVQLLPVAVALVAFSTGVATNVLDGGIETMLFWVVTALLSALSLYWTTSTFMALIIVTLPGMYPMKALKAAGDLVIGRRVRILLRILWLLILLVLTWAVVMIPLILFDTWLKGIFPAIDWLPLVPSAFLVLGTITVVWSASYIYLLYRKIVDDDADPA